MWKMMHRRLPRKRRLTLLVTLVAFVFCILLISVSFAVLMMYLMYRLGLMQPMSDSRLPLAITFLLVISLFMAMIITLLAGQVSLRPLQRFVDATREIAAGNFDARVHVPEFAPQEYMSLATSFNDMACELGGIEALGDDFINGISHEFKTPVVSIRGFARLLRRGGLTQAQQEEYLDVIIAESDRLAQLSGNVLLLSRLDKAGGLDGEEPCALDEQLRRVVLLLDAQAVKKGVDIGVDLAPCTLTASPELLEQVWINLLQNAIKFTPAGGRVAVALADTPREARVTISDTGIGIAPEEARRVFDKFYQADESRACEGNGLGLSLVRRIVRLHGGAVAVESAPGEGATFTVTLPKARGGVA